MSFWLRMMRQEITVETYTARNAYGDPSFDAGVVYPARVEEYSDTITLEDGVEVTVSHRVATSAALKIGDRITLPDGIKRTVRGVQRGQRLHASQSMTVGLLG